MKKDEMQRMLRNSSLKATAAKPDVPLKPEAEYEESNLEASDRVFEVREGQDFVFDLRQQRRFAAWYERNFWEVQRRALQNTHHLLAGLKEHEYTHYRMQSIARTVGCGTLAVLLLGGQFWVESLPAPLGSAFASFKPSLGILMIFSGAMFAFMAWPRYVVNGLGDSEMEERRRYQEEFRRRFKR